MSEDCVYCVLCGKFIESINKVSFVEKKGFEFNVPRIGYRCLECLTKEAVETFDSFSKHLITGSPKCPKINWNCFIESGHNQEAIARLLLALGVLSSSLERNWIILGVGLKGLNPRTSDVYLYFVRREDVVAYASLKFGKTDYNWQIVQISTIMLSKEQVLKEAQSQSP